MSNPPLVVKGLNMNQPIIKIEKSYAKGVYRITLKCGCKHYATKKPQLGRLMPCKGH